MSSASTLCGLGLHSSDPTWNGNLIPPPSLAGPVFCFCSLSCGLALEGWRDGGQVGFCRCVNPSTLLTSTKPRPKGKSYQSCGQVRVPPAGPGLKSSSVLEQACSDQRQPPPRPHHQSCSKVHSPVQCGNVCTPSICWCSVEKQPRNLAALQPLFLYVWTGLDLWICGNAAAFRG